MEGFELSASVALWRGDEVLFMKRSSGSFSGGGWFLPGGHVEAGERPAEAAVREVFEEAGIVLDAATLSPADVMTYDHDGGAAHCIIYNAVCPRDAELVLNDEHVVARWYTPAAFVARFNNPEFLREKGVPEDAITLAQEVARVVMGAARARGARPQLDSD
jgi:8-oxo-dGTP diphosphatase